MADSKRDNRFRVGNAHWQSKLQEKDIPIIFSLHNSGVSLERIAKKFYVSLGAIFKVVHRKTWSHVKID